MFENGRLDTRQAKLPESLERPTIAHIVPGTAFWVDADSIWVDEDRHVWVNDHVPLTQTSEDFVSRVVRVISFDEGLVLDVSSLRDDEGNAAQFDIAPFSEYIDDAGFEIGEFLPIIAIVSHRDELKQISDMFRYRYGVKLNGKPVNVSPNRGNDKKSKKKSKVPKT